jgi:hypothetical protein
MATQIDRPPAQQPKGDLYETDFYVWAREQAALLRAGRFDEVDLQNLVEEVEELGGSLQRKVGNRAITIMEHLLKLQHSPATTPRLGWRGTIRAQRTKLLRELTPQLKHHLADDLANLYARARHDAQGALRDHGEDAAANALPTTCPYGLDRITGDWLP